MIHRVLAAAMVMALSGVAQADPAPVKVCVAVAGDADEVMRAAAETVADAVAHHAGFRGVADNDARAALRGDPTAASDFADLATTRRALRGEDRDAAALDGVSSRLGCGLVVELVARPAGALVRVYDPVRRVWPASRESATVDATIVDSVLVPAVALRDAPAASLAVTSPPTGSPPVAANVARAVAPTPSPQRSAWGRVWPWAVVGGVAAAVVAVYFIASDDGNPSSTRVTIVHRGL